MNGDFAPKASFGNYEVERSIGKGGMGEVYLVRHRVLGTTCALKVIRTGRHAGESASARFLREAQVMAHLGTHPAIVRVHDFGHTPEGHPWFVMDYIPGARTLADRVKEEGPVPAWEAASLMQQVADALGMAHEQGVIHRDIKPDNILLTPEGQPVVTDFGLAKVLLGSHPAGSDLSLTRSGEAPGTPRYMAPEQVAGERERLGPATDVFALGGLLYFLLSGTHPFKAASEASLVKRILMDDPPPLPASVPGELKRIVSRALQKEPEDRHPNAAALKQALGSFVRGGTDRRRRNWVVLGGAALLIGFALLVPRFLDHEPNPPPVAETREDFETPPGEAGETSQNETEDPEPPRLGWHGEPLPDGLRRDEQEGDYIWEKDGAVMVYVPAGTFTMGRADGMERETPVHRVSLDAFYIDKYEVTRGQFRTFVADQRYRTLPEIDGRARVRRANGWTHENGVSWRTWHEGDFIQTPRHPVVYVSFAGALKYARWAGKRLPSEAEWEYAARGPEGPLYPWGDEPNFEWANLFDASNPLVERDKAFGIDDGFPWTAPVDAFPENRSWVGARNLLGNVAEFCRDAYDPTFYSRSPERNPVNRKSHHQIVIRGGSWLNTARTETTTMRRAIRRGETFPFVGFRCVLPAD